MRPALKKTEPPKKKSKSKLELPALLAQLNKVKNSDEALVLTAASILKEHGVSDDNSIFSGRIPQQKAEEIQVVINDIVAKFQDTESFNWKVHILDVVHGILTIAKTADHFEDRQALEELIVQIAQDLFKRYNPKIPYLPGFIGNWVKKLIVKTIVPAVTDWVLDKIYGDD